ncbi:MAG: hypothetical protein M9955_11545 [Rhizobiaceae bacterium]|nr:hypothetical protein [Rhizobiaceae bacterium]
MRALMGLAFGLAIALFGFDAQASVFNTKMEDAFRGSLLSIIDRMGVDYGREGQWEVVLLSEHVTPTYREVKPDFVAGLKGVDFHLTFIFFNERSEGVVPAKPNLVDDTSIRPYWLEMRRLFAGINPRMDPRHVGQAAYAINVSRADHNNFAGGRLASVSKLNGSREAVFSYVVFGRFAEQVSADLGLSQVACLNRPGFAGGSNS